MKKTLESQINSLPPRLLKLTENVLQVTQTVGATVTRGQGIGMTSMTMTVSTWIDGEAINPLFYVRMN